MIALVAAAAVLLPGPQVVEMPEPDAGSICLQAIAPLPSLGPRAWFAARVLARTMTLETVDYTRGVLLTYSLQGGDRMRCFLTEDTIRLQLTVPKGQLDIGVALLESVARRPTLAPASIREEAEQLPFRRPALWEEALAGKRSDVAHFRETDVAEIHATLFRPESLIVAVGGAFEPGSARAAVEKRFAGWVGERLGRPLPESVLPTPVPTQGRLRAVSLVGPAFSGRDVELPIRLLATIALGCGKGSSAFKVLREGLGASYRQEALWLPVQEGFQPRIQFLHYDASPDDGDLGVRARTALLKDVESWGEPELRRAQGMARLIWTSGLPASPLYFKPGAPVGDSLEDRTFLAGYWPWKTGRAYDPKRLLQAMELVRLEEMKAHARQTLEASMLQVVRAEVPPTSLSPGTLSSPAAPLAF